jgi:predicted kinase
MRIEALADADAVARAGAAFTAAEARAAIAARGRFIAAISGGHTPWTMLRALADEQMPWAGRPETPTATSPTCSARPGTTSSISVRTS